MATRVLLRSLFSSANETLIPRFFTSSAYLQRLRPIVAVAEANLRQSSLARAFSTSEITYYDYSLVDSYPNWSNVPPKDTTLPEGCDLEHWLVIVEKPKGEPTRDAIIDSYINTLAKIVGSYDEARMKIYSVSTRCYYAFGALVTEEYSYYIKKLPNVLWVLPDCYLDVKNKDYGGEPFINGKAVPYDAKYHVEWLRNMAHAIERKRRNESNFEQSQNLKRGSRNVRNNETPRGSLSSLDNNWTVPSPPYPGGLPNVGEVRLPHTIGGMGPIDDNGLGPNSNAPPPNVGGGNPYQNQASPLHPSSYDMNEH